MDNFFSNIDWQHWHTMAQTWGVRIIFAIIIFIIGSWISRRVSNMVIRLLKAREYDGLLTSFIGNIVYMALMAAVIIAALDAVGVETTSFLAVVGAAGLAIGLALKDSLGNLASGVMIVGLRPFTEGDFVEVAGTSGTVRQVRLFHTTLYTPDNRKIIIPNGQITSGTISNFTAMDTRRIDMMIGVGYDDDLKVAQEVMNRVVTSHDQVLTDPAPAVLLMELADSSVNFAVRPWVKKEDYWTVRADLLESLKFELEKAGCSIPYPQQDVHIHYPEKAA